MRYGRLAVVVLTGLVITACGSLLEWGRNFPSPKPGVEIQNNVTTKADLVRLFGQPGQVGFRNGDQTWTWVYGKKGSGQEPDLTKQLEVTFNAQGVVKDHAFSSNLPEDMKAR